jgi:hypothetical protein
MIHRKRGTAVCGSRNYELLGHPSHFVAERKQTALYPRVPENQKFPRQQGVIHRAFQVHPIQDCESTGLDYVKQAIPQKYLLQDHLSGVKTLKYIIIFIMIHVFLILYEHKLN